MALHGRKWSHVAKLVPGRTDVQCRERYMNCLNPGGWLGAGGLAACRRWTRVVRWPLATVGLNASYPGAVEGPTDCCSALFTHCLLHPDRHSAFCFFVCVSAEVHAYRPWTRAEEDQLLQLCKQHTQVSERLAGPAGCPTVVASMALEVSLPEHKRWRSWSQLGTCIPGSSLNPRLC